MVTMPTDLATQVASVYYTAFLMCIVVNHKTAAFHGYPGTIDFVFDDGNKFKRHVVAAHDAIQNSAEMQQYQVGTLDFGGDSSTPALQAADVVAWSARRRKAGLTLDGALSPLKGLFDEMFVDQPLEEHVLAELVAAYFAVRNRNSPDE